MKRFVALILGVLMLIVAFQTVYAKGTNRAVITGGTIDGELVVDNLEDAMLLSIGTFENVNQGEILQPEVLGDEYAIERQFIGTTETIIPFDRVRYYPDRDGGLGYVHYIGIVNGSSEYDDNWYRVSLEGESAFQRVMYGSDVRPYVVLTNGSGILQVLDVVSLETLATINLGADAPVEQIITSAHGRELYYEVDGIGHVVNLVEATNCPVESAPAWALNYPTTPQPLDLLSEDVLEEVSFNEQAQVVHYNEYWFYLFDPTVAGIGLFERYTGLLTDQILLDTQFSQVVIGWYSVYGIMSDADGTWLIADSLLDEYDENQVRLADGQWLLAYVALDLRVLNSDEVVMAGC